MAEQPVLRFTRWPTMILFPLEATLGIGTIVWLMDHLLGYPYPDRGFVALVGALCYGMAGVTWLLFLSLDHTIELTGDGLVVRSWWRRRRLIAWSDIRLLRWHRHRGLSVDGEHGSVYLSAYPRYQELVSEIERRWQAHRRQDVPEGSNDRDGSPRQGVDPRHLAWTTTRKRREVEYGVFTFFLLALAVSLVWAELNTVKAVQVSIRPGMAEQAVRSLLGEPRAVCSQGTTELAKRYAEGFGPPPPVRGWARALVYFTRGNYLHVVYLDRDGKVLCVVTSQTVAQESASR